MAYYLVQGAYTAEAWKALVKKPHDRIEVVRTTLAKLGGRVEGAWFAFGEYDVVLVMNVPDNISAAAFALAVAAGGAFRTSKTTPLISIADGIEAMKKAGTLDYRPPTA
jgi:uncharacterized protein with GYD domain